MGWKQYVRSVQAQERREQREAARRYREFEKMQRTNSATREPADGNADSCRSRGGLSDRCREVGLPWLSVLRLPEHTHDIPKNLGDSRAHWD